MEAASKELIKELEAEIQEKEQWIKRFRAGWSDSEETVTGLRNTRSWRNKEIKELKEREEELKKECERTRRGSSEEQ